MNEQIFSSKQQTFSWYKSRKQTEEMNIVFILYIFFLWYLKIPSESLSVCYEINSTHELIRCISRLENVIIESELCELWIKPCIWFNVNEKLKTNLKKKIQTKIWLPFMKSSIWKLIVSLFAWNIYIICCIFVFMFRASLWPNINDFIIH